MLGKFVCLTLAVVEGTTRPPVSYSKPPYSVTFIFNRQHLFAVSKLVEKARRFFPPSSVAEILEEFLPNLSPPSMTSTVIAQTLLCSFLPTNVIPSPPLENAPPLYYLPTVFSLWQTFTHSGFDGSFLDLLARVARDQVGTPEHAQWTPEQIKFIFTVALKSMELPVGSGTTVIGSSGRGLLQGSPSGVKLDTTDMVGQISRNKLESFARFAVYTIYPSPRQNQIDTLR